jgi:deazaflavin-dependent oxidoreductase (nitroreductase family)
MLKSLKRLAELQYFAGEYLALRLTPQSGPGPISRFFFRGPLLLYNLGLGRLISKQVLLLTTTGRKSGEKRMVPLGYTSDSRTGAYYVSAGWAGHSNWYRNALANCKVRVRIGNKEFDAIAEPVDECEAIRLFEGYAHRNPFAESLYSRIIGRPYDSREESLREIVEYFPTMILRLHS